jgi:predicted CXXCH cytochrome family protein
MLKRTIAVLVCMAAGSGLAMAASVIGSDHDLSSAGNTDEVCVYCHTSHQADAAAGQPPLWNHEFPSPVPNYGVYTSPTLDATPTQIGEALGAAGASMLCMSCHDGSVAISALYNPPNSGGPDPIAALSGNADLGQDMSDDHPVNFSYQESIDNGDTGLNAAASVDDLLLGGSVQCASCHQAHDPQFEPFLRQSNVGSALCVRCHIK